MRVSFRSRSALCLIALVLSGGCSHVRVPRPHWPWRLAPADDLRGKAEAGDAAAQYTLGFSLLYGDGMARNIDEGLTWLRKSGDNGYLKAQTALGQLFLKGIPDVPKNPAEAVR